MKPFAAVQRVFKYNSESSRYEFCGSSFRLWADDFYLTARHCVAGLSPKDLFVMNCLDDESNIKCLAIHEHPKADLAVLRVEDAVPSQFQKFSLTTRDSGYGTAIHCFGILADWLTTHDHATCPGRVIGGIIQRDFIHNDGEYISAVLEYSAPIPIGMSGGPAFFANHDSVVLGMAIGTIKSSIVVHQHVEYESEQVIEREKISEITRYGVILRLLEYKSWLEQIIPPRATE